MIFFIVESIYEESLVHRVNLLVGKYLIPKTIEGTVDEQVKQLIRAVRMDKPELIVFDTRTVGSVIKQTFLSEIVRLKEPYTIDDIGNITYIENNYKNFGK